MLGRLRRPLLNNLILLSSILHHLTNKYLMLGRLPRPYALNYFIFLSSLLHHLKNNYLMLGRLRRPY